MHLNEALERSVNSLENRSIESDLHDRDIALLKIRNTDDLFNEVSFVKEPDYAMGHDVYTIGFPLSYILGVKPRLNRGLISSTAGVKDNPNFLQVSAEIQPGNSGGPLLNEKGQVVGMIAMTLDSQTILNQTGTTPQNVNFALKSSALLSYLDGLENVELPDIRLGEEVPFESVQQSVV